MAGLELTGNAPRQSRTTGYHNVLFDPNTSTDDWIYQPPSYDLACSGTTRTQIPVIPIVAPGTEQLPPYNPTIEDSGICHVRYERNNPFDLIEDQSWSETFLVLRGTRLAFHQVSTPNIFNKIKIGYGAGRLVKFYTLQHAEVGIASDHKKYELVPKNPMTALLPEAMQNRMKQSEPHLFDPVRMYVIRLRVECDQVLLRFKSWDERAKWIDHLCAAIDISPPIEERSEPSKHTLPRRRRHRHRATGADGARTHLQSLVEQQERIIRERFPHLMTGVSDEQDNDPQETNEDPEAEDLDNSVVNADGPPSPTSDNENGNNRSREDSSPLATPVVEASARERGLSIVTTQTPTTQTPAFQTPISRTPTSRTPTSPPVPQIAFSSMSTNISARVKLPPTPQMDASGEARYRRRCMPSLLHNSRRANDGIVIYAGSRWRIDFDAKLLRPWPEQLPKYTVGKVDSTQEGTISFGTTSTENNSRDKETSNQKDKLNKPTLRKVRSTAEIASGPGRDPNLSLIGAGKSSSKKNRDRNHAASATAATATPTSAPSKTTPKPTLTSTNEDHMNDNAIIPTSTAESSSAESSLNTPDESSGRTTRMLFKDMGRRIKLVRRKTGPLSGNGNGCEDVNGGDAQKSEEVGMAMAWTQRVDARSLELN